MHRQHGNRMRYGEYTRLELLANKVRQNSIWMVDEAQSGHPGTALSVTDILVSLYSGREFVDDHWEHYVNFNPKDTKNPKRDRILISKGHATPAIYSLHAELGIYDEEYLKDQRKANLHEYLKTFRQANSNLEGHGDMARTKGIEYNSGPLGTGLAGAAGMAWASQIDDLNYNVFVVLGDGECQEGNTKEAFQTVPNKNLNNICIFIDKNNLQIDGDVRKINNIDNIDRQLMGYGWEVYRHETPIYGPNDFLIGNNMKVYEQQRPLVKKNAEAYGRELRYWIDGHNFNEILNSIHHFKHRVDKSKPLAVIAKTIKCKGVEDWEGCVESHGKALPPKMYKKAWKHFDREIMRLKLALPPPHMQLEVKPYE